MLTLCRAGWGDTAVIFQKWIMTVLSLCFPRGSAVALPWLCRGSAVALLWLCCGSVSCPPAVSLLRLCYGCVVSLPWLSCTSAVALLCFCCGLLCFYSGSSVTQLCFCCGSATLLFWLCRLQFLWQDPGVHLGYEPLTQPEASSQ